MNKQKKENITINTGKLKYLNLDDNSINPKVDINIVFGVDDNYITQLATLIISILLNSSKECNFNFYVLNTGIKEENKKKLETIKNIREFNLNYIDVSNYDFSKFPLNRDGISIATYYRLFIPDVIPNNIEKCLYLDCDMLVEDDLLELWNYDIANYLAGVVEDESGKDNAKRLRLPDGSKYFNAGLLLNLKNIRESNFVENVFDFYNNNKDLITLQDQDLLNGVFCGKCKYLDLRWNINTPAYMKTKCNHFYTDEEEDFASKNPGIIHFTGPFKPWFTSSYHPLRKEYFRYLSYFKFKKDIENFDKIFGLPICIKGFFSIKNEGAKKVIYILGIKINIRRNNA